MLVNMHSAKSQLSKLIAAAEAGEEVVITRNGRPAVRFVPVRRARFQFGTLQHLVSRVPDFDDKMSVEELALWERVP